MINMVKANVYRLVNSKLCRNTFITVGILVALVVGGPKLFSSGVYPIHLSNAERAFGFAYNYFNDRTMPMAVEMFVSALGFVPVLFIIAILYVEEFISKPYRNGSLANTIACGYKRSQVYMAKIGTIILTMVALVLTLLVGTVSISMIIPSVRESMSFDVFRIMILMTLLVALCLVACISIMSLIAMQIKKAEWIVVVVICLFVVSATIISNDYVIGKGMSYNPFAMLMDICFKIPSLGTAYFIVMTCIAEIIISILMGCWIIKKQEVK